jgi:hypothetical protein
MSYLLLYGVFALWVVFDGLSRKLGMSVLLWTLGTIILGPIILPIYLASRPLKHGETREGGKGWNVLKNFAILWTVVMAIATIAGLMAMAKNTTDLNSDAARAGAGIGMVLGMGFLAALWFFPTMGAALLGFLLKKSSIVETGPTGPLVGRTSSATAAGGWGGLILVALLGMVVVGVATSRGISTSAPKSTAELPSTPVSTGDPIRAAASSGGAWEIVQKSNEMDGTKAAYVSVNSANEISGLVGSVRPTLTIQCAKHKPELVINVGGPLQSEYGQYDTYAVRVKFDNGKPLPQRWTGSTNNRAIFSPSPGQLIKQLSKTNTFYLEFTPFEKAETTVTFPVSGLKEKLTAVQDVCGGLSL